MFSQFRMLRVMRHPLQQLLITCSFWRLNQSDIDIKINYSTDKPTNKLVKISITSDEIFTVINNSGKTEKE